MKKRLLVGVGTVVVVALIGWAALRQPSAQPNPPPPPPTPSPAPATTASEEFPTVPRVSLAEARQRIEAGNALVIDVRDADSYIANHIPGAIHIPLPRIEGEINYLPRGKPVLTYCT